MTVATQLKQTLAGLKSAQASLEGFALQTNNESAKQLFDNCSKQAQHLVNALAERVHEIEKEEPQYK